MEETIHFSRDSGTKSLECKLSYETHHFQTEDFVYTQEHKLDPLVRVARSMSEQCQIKYVYSLMLPLSCTVTSPGHSPVVSDDIKK
jgi:hypothetical protein